DASWCRAGSPARRTGACSPADRAPLGEVRRPCPLAEDELDRHALDAGHLIAQAAERAHLTGRRGAALGAGAELTAGGLRAVGEQRRHPLDEIEVERRLRTRRF